MEQLGDVGHVESRLIRLEKVLVLMEDWCMVCAKRTIGSDIVLDAPMELLGDVGHEESHSVHLETMLVSLQDRCTVLVSVQDKCMVCPRHVPWAQKIILDTPDGNTR